MVSELEPELSRKVETMTGSSARHRNYRLANIAEIGNQVVAFEYLCLSLERLVKVLYFVAGYFVARPQPALFIFREVVLRSKHRCSLTSRNMRDTPRPVIVLVRSSAERFHTDISAPTYSDITGRF